MLVYTLSDVIFFAVCGVFLLACLFIFLVYGAIQFFDKIRRRRNEHLHDQGMD